MWKIVFPVLAAVFAAGHGVMVGNPRDADINDEGVQNALKFAVSEYNRRTNDLYLRQVSEVVKVQSQVVAGTMYILTVKMGRTPCRKDAPQQQLCAVYPDPEDARPYQCTFSVWSRPWINDIRLVEEKCQSENNTGDSCEPALLAV